MRQLIKHLYLLLLLGYIAVHTGCSQKQSIAGGTSTSENARLSGTIVNASGLPATYTVVQLIPVSYNPVTDSHVNSIKTDTTGIDGHYSFDSIPAGNYNIIAVQPSSGMRLMKNTISIVSDSIVINPDTLRNTGTIKITIPDTAGNEQSYVYIPGTTIAQSTRYATNDSGTITITIDSVPIGTLPPIYYNKNPGISQPQHIGTNIQVREHDTVNVGISEWRYHKMLYLNTSTTGAYISDTITNFPVLIRLTAANFNFQQSSQYGFDIRFTKADNTPLHYEIETWDSAKGNAAIWVTLDTIFPQSITQYFRMHWGNLELSTIDSSSSTAVFDTSAGFSGVWHMNLLSNTQLADATAHHYNGFPHGTAKTTSANAIAGNAQVFDGTCTSFELGHTANSALNFPQQGNYSISAWVYTSALDNAFHTVFSKGNFQYALQINKNNIVEFFEFQNKAGWNSTNTGAAAQAWTYVTGVRNGNKQLLYVNGEMVDSTIKTIASPNSRSTQINACIGNQLWGSDTRFFNGVIDEVRAESRSRSSDWIRLCYLNQRQNNLLIKY